MFLVLVLAVMSFGASHANERAFGGLIIITLPSSVIATAISYIIGLAFFDNTSGIIRIGFVLLWIGCGMVQATILHYLRARIGRAHNAE
jgi:hypothetical protein